MCGQIHDDPPHIAMPYFVGDLSDSNTVKLARYFEENFIQNMIGQHALWAHTDNASKEELIKMEQIVFTLAKTINILNEAGIITTLNPTENIIEEKNINETEEKYVMVDKKYIYGAASLISVLILTIIILLVRIKKLRA